MTEMPKERIQELLNFKKEYEDEPETEKCLEELLAYKETELTPDEINGMKKRHEKIDLMAIEYDNICEKYDKLYGKEQMWCIGKKKKHD